MLPYHQDIENCFADRIGPAGIDRAVFMATLEKVNNAAKDIYNYQNGRARPLLEMVKRQDDLPFLQEIAKKIRKNYKAMVVLGTGGSTLNPQSIVALRREIDPEFKIYFADNIDPFYTESLFSCLDIKKTAILSISKSGGTLETLIQTLLCINKLEEARVKSPGKQIFIITDPKPSTLRDIGKQVNATILDHEENIGGRFSTFTSVGLLPAMVAGIDAAALRLGARRVIEDCLASKNSYPAQGAALALLAAEKKLGIKVYMPYIESLQAFTLWVSQIWAESLGKNGNGTTPVCAVGTLDQHSQLQLYLDGPADKVFTIFGLENSSCGPVINSRFISGNGLSYLEGKSFGQVNGAAQLGTAATIAGHGRPVRLINLKTYDAEALGALMMHFTLETILTAQMLGINAFDQPAVEEGKVLARKLLGEQ